MRRTLIATGMVLIVIGIVWVTQGIGALKGSFMTGSAFWAWVGVIALVAGLVMTILGSRRKRPDGR